MKYDYQAMLNAILDAPTSVEVAESIGEALGRGWRRANPPTGYAGRRCRVASDDPANVYTIIGEPYIGGGHSWVCLEDASGRRMQVMTQAIKLIPWMADEAAEVSDA